MNYFNDATGEYARSRPRSYYSDSTGETFYSHSNPVPCAECEADTNDENVGRFEEGDQIFCEACYLALPEKIEEF